MKAMFQAHVERVELAATTNSYNLGQVGRQAENDCQTNVNMVPFP